MAHVLFFWTCASWTVGVLGFRLTQLKHAIGLTKLNYLELGHGAVGVLGREAVGVLKVYVCGRMQTYGGSGETRTRNRHRRTKSPNPCP